MTVASKLRGAFALYIGLLAGVLVYHVRTSRHSVESGHELTAISARYRVISDEQLGRIAEMGRSAEKYMVTRDAGYLERFAALAQEFGDEVQRLQDQPVSDDERAPLRQLAERWPAVEIEARRLVRDTSAAGIVETLMQLEPALDQATIETQQLGTAAQSAMTRELMASERAARDAERIAWGTTAVALLLSILLSALLVRSIIRPLDKLARGTREISAGRLGFRLDAAGGRRGGDELAELAREFNAMTARLEELDRLKRDFVSNVSHDLKTPLSSMQEANEVLLDGLAGPLSDKQRQLLGLSRDSGRRLSAMIAKLLELSRLESIQTPSLELLDVTQVIRRSVDRANVSRHERGTPVTLDEPIKRLLVLVNGDALTQVVDNLLENALKFSPAQGAVRVSVAQHCASVLLTVSDDGPGIPDGDKERVFERFYQTDVGRSVHGRGAGLGLAICRHIIAAHGGSIWASDNTPRGSALCVRLPLVAAVPFAHPTVVVESAA